MLVQQASGVVAAIQLAATKASSASRSSPLNPAWFTPAQIQQAYGFNQVPFLELNGQPNSTTYNDTAGKGQTIASIDVYDDPNILSDANVFSKQFGLPQFNQGTANSPTFVKLNENGQNITSEPKGVPHPQTNSAWTSEISLDVEWRTPSLPRPTLC